MEGTTVFDPNYGEFTVRSDPDQMASLLQSLANRYRKPTGSIYRQSRRKGCSELGLQAGGDWRLL
ncbi:YopT-type cysteine protease domain-containing protein [Bradyrhizobium cajani]|nr:YopT-type cysteine protease domain-containing protein [Bradyrhizobium cajani]